MPKRNTLKSKLSIIVFFRWNWTQKTNALSFHLNCVFHKFLFVWNVTAQSIIISKSVVGELPKWRSWWLYSGQNARHCEGYYSKQLRIHDIRGADISTVQHCPYAWKFQKAQKTSTKHQERSGIKMPQTEDIEYIKKYEAYDCINTSEDDDFDPLDELYEPDPVEIQNTSQNTGSKTARTSYHSSKAIGYMPSSSLISWQIQVLWATLKTRSKCS